MIEDLNGEKITGTFYEQELQKINGSEFIIEKGINKRLMNCMLNGKVMIIHIIVRLMQLI